MFASGRGLLAASYVVIVMIHFCRSNKMCWAVCGSLSSGIRYVMILTTSIFRKTSHDMLVHSCGLNANAAKCLCCCYTRGNHAAMRPPPTLMYIEMDRYIYIHTRIDIHKHVHKHTHTYILLSYRSLSHICVCMDVCMYACACAFVCVCVRVAICV